MIFAKSDVSTRATRNRRDLPGRSIWPYVLTSVVIIALGGLGLWAYSGHLAGLNKPNFLNKLFPPSTVKDSLHNRVSTTESAVPVTKSKGKKKERPAESAKSESRGKVENSSPPPTIEGLRAENADLRQQLLDMAPKGFYVVINTAGNRVSLRNGDKLEADMVASCGSGNVLQDPKGGRSWTFDTPRGVFTVKTKVVDPVWIKPDWAFIEEAEPIPKNRADRAAPGEMGDFAIGIGDGYYMHGTLYKRLLGRNVSHGCVRLGDADIERLYHTLSKGDRVYIF